MTPESFSQSRDAAEHQKETASSAKAKKKSSTKKKKQDVGNAATTKDPATANLDVIPRLLFEGMTSQKATTVETAVEGLADIFRLSGGKRVEAYEAGGHAVLITIMKKWMHNESIQTSSCRCIQNMSCTHNEAKESFAAIGGLESILTAMRTFPTSQRVQRSGCGALMNLLSGNDEESKILQTMSKKFVQEYEGIPLVVNAMRTFPQELKVQLWGNGLFQNLAQTKSFRLDMMRGGAVTAAGASLEGHCDDASIQQHVTKLMLIMFTQ